MALPNEHLMTFNQYKDAKTLFAAIQTGFGGFRRLNKPNLDTMSFDDLYNNFKIVEQEVKETTISRSSSQNMAFVSSPSSTNEVNTAYGVSTANTQVSPASTQVSIASTQVSIVNLSDYTVYAFLASQPNGSQLVYEDLEQIHKDDTEEIDLKWQLALLSMRKKSFSRKLVEKSLSMEVKQLDMTNPRRSVSTIIRYDTLQGNAKLFLPPKFDLSNSGLEEFQQPEFEGYGPKPSKSVSEDTSNKVRESPDAPLVKKLMSDDKLEKKTIFPTVAKLPNSIVVNAVRANQVNAVKASAYFKEFDEGYVTFRGGAKGGKITGKGTLKTGKLDFEDVYFVKELQFNLFSVLQMCDKKNIVLFTDTGCFVLSPDFKLADES
ncbi:hypothetical protein Tco_0448936 [Tanacetum coccineum]